MSRDAMTVGLSPKNGWVSHIEGHDVARFSTATRHFVALCHPDDIDHVLHAGRLNYYKSYEYELLRAILGVSLFTDEEDSWQRYRTMLSPMFAKRHLNGLVDLMIEPIDALLADYGQRGSAVRTGDGQRDGRAHLERRRKLFVQSGFRTGGRQDVVEGDRRPEVR